MSDFRPQSFGVQEYLAVFRRRRWWVVGCVVALTGLSLGYSLWVPDQYRANAEIVVAESDSIDLVGSSVTTAAEQRQVIQTELRYVESRLVSTEADSRLGYEADISASAPDESRVITIEATSEDPDRAAEAANTYADVYIELRRDARVEDYLTTADAVQARIGEIDAALAATSNPTTIAGLETQRSAYTEVLENLALGADLSGGQNAQVISRAEAPTEPFSPRVVLNTIAGAILGLLAGLGVALLRDVLDQRIANKAALESITGGTLPTLALIPPMPELEKSPNLVATLEAPESQSAEAYRTLRAAVQFIAVSQKVQVIQVTSALPGEGKSTTTINLAASLARAGKRVVVVDGDLRRPRCHRFFGVPGWPGVGEVLTGSAGLADTVQHVGPLESVLGLLPAGAHIDHTAEALSTGAAHDMIRAMREYIDVILIDSPPVLPVADALVLSDLADAVILVSRAKTSTRREVARAIELLRQVNAPLIGTILNDVHSSDEGGYSYTYGYSTDRASTRSEVPATKPSKPARQFHWKRTATPEPTEAETSEVSVSTSTNGSDTDAMGSFWDDVVGRIPSDASGAIETERVDAEVGR